MNRETTALLRVAVTHGIYNAREDNSPARFVSNLLLHFSAVSKYIVLCAREDNFSPLEPTICTGLLLTDFFKGILGGYYSVRHDLGHYRSACVAATYSISSANGGVSQAWLRDSLERSLQITIKHNAALSLGIAHLADDKSPGFIQLDEIQQHDVIQYIQSEDDSDQPESEIADPDALLCKEIGKAHGHLWCSGKPAWKILILFYGGGPVNGSPMAEHVDGNTHVERLDIAFLAHHAIADGLSGVAFHNSLMASFNMATNKDNHSKPIWPLIPPPNRAIPSAVEDHVDIFASKPHQDPNRHKPVWAGKDISKGMSQDEYVSRVRLITISSDSAARVLQASRGYQVSLTALLHAFICASLSHYLGDIPGFRAVTPFSLRKFTNATSLDIVNHISFMSNYTSSEKIKQLRGSLAGSSAEYKSIIGLAREFSKEIQEEVSRFPDGNNIAGLSRIENIEQHCRNDEGKTRQYTYELSNLGRAMRVPPSPTNPLTLERFAFTQCGMVTGPALGLNCVSVSGGALGISITWQEGIVEESLVDYLCKDLEKRLTWQCRQLFSDPILEGFKFS